MSCEEDSETDWYFCYHCGEEMTEFDGGWVCDNCGYIDGR